jgi:hypothetical protein
MLLGIDHRQKSVAGNASTELNPNAFHFIKVDLVAAPIVKLGRAG